MTEANTASCTTYHLGVDPGWVNLGAAVTKCENGEWSLVASRTFNPSKSLEFTDDLNNFVESALGDCLLGTTCIERYVSYKGVLTPEAENILMLIGEMKQAIRYEIFTPDNTTHLVRAIDWKTSLVKYLVKNKGFDNPSTSLDKKFSIAAAKCIIGDHEIKTDHEADAICLSAYPVLFRKEAG